MGGGGEVESDLENCASEKNPGYAPGFFDYHEINEELLFRSSGWQDPLRQDPFLKNPSLLLIKTGFGQTMHLALTLSSIALVQLLL